MSKQTFFKKTDTINRCAKLPAYIIQLAQDQSKLDAVIKLLFSNSENGKKCYQNLSQANIRLLKSSPNWEGLLSLINNTRELTEDERMAFYYCIGDLKITRNIVASLYAAADRCLPETGSPSMDAANFKVLLEQFLARDPRGCKILLVEGNIDDGFAVNCSRGYIIPLEDVIKSKSNKFYLTLSMATALFDEVVRLYGINSLAFDRIREWNKLSETLRILRISCESISRTNSTQGDYVLHDIPPLSIARITNILNYPSLAPEEKMGCFNKALQKLEKKVIALERKAIAKTKYYGDAANASRNLLEELRQHGNDYFLNPSIDYPEFKRLCIELIKGKEEVLEVQHGWSAFLTALLKLINSLGKH